MASPVGEVAALPPVYYRWLSLVRRYPMFDVWREGVLCSVRLTRILEPGPEERDVFAHRYRLREWLPNSYLPLGYDAFGNVLLWDLHRGAVVFRWGGSKGKSEVHVADTLEDLCEKLYYRPIR